LTAPQEPTPASVVDATFERLVSRLGATDTSELPELTSNEAAVCRIVWLQASVDNGGFVSFFYNSYGNHTAETLAALDRIGAVEASGLLSAAAALFGPSGPSRDHERREQQLRHLPADADDVLYALDESFYGQEHALQQHLAAFIQSAAFRDTGSA
jgi:hypothetical protein